MKPGHIGITRPFYLTGVVMAIAVVGTAPSAWAEPAVVENPVATGVASDETTFDLIQVVEGLEHPWAVAWLPDGRMLVTERAGRLHLVDGESITEVNNLPLIGRWAEGEEDAGQGGLLDVAVHPDYEENEWIYFTYSSPGDDDAVYGDVEAGTGTTMFRARLSDDDSELVDQETIYSQAPRTDPGRHYGSRIVFLDDGTVLMSIGDRGLRRPSQDLSDPAGSILRLNEDGGAAEDNPFVEAGLGNARPEIYTFGNRNNQGLAVHPETGEVWALEHGPQGGDLLFKVEAGDNYGWPQVAFGTEYSTGEPIGIGTEAPGVKAPAHVWEGQMAPSGLTFYDGDAFPEWQGNAFAGSLGFEQLHRLEVNEDAVANEEILLAETVGRIRDVRQGPDDFLYVVTDEADGGIYQIRPPE